MPLPDPARSRAILIGTNRYRSDDISDLPAVLGNLTDLTAALTNHELGSLRADRCEMLLSPVLTMAYRALRNTALQAEDTLVVYFAGHGFTSARNELLLGFADTELDELSVTALRAQELRDILLRSPARAKVLILDCCFAGRVFADHMTAQMNAILGQVEVEGTYVLASTQPNELAVAAPGDRHTAFTGELLRLMREGIPDGPDLLTFESLFPLLSLALSRRGLPKPEQRNSGTIGGLALSRNSAMRHGRSLPSRASAPQLQLRTELTTEMRLGHQAADAVHESSATQLFWEGAKRRLESGESEPLQPPHQEAQLAPPARTDGAPGVLYVLVCGLPVARDVGVLVDLAQRGGWEVCVVTTPEGRIYVDVASLRAQTGHPVRTQRNSPGDPDVLPEADAMIVAPATVNTINKWAAGITDTLLLSLLVEGYGYGIPIVVVPYPDAISALHPRFNSSLTELRQWGVQVLYGDDVARLGAPGQEEQFRGLFPWQRALQALSVRP